MRWLTWMPLTLVTVLGALLRLHCIDTSLWLDELHTGWVVIDGPAYFVERAAPGNYSPVYFLFPWLATIVCGPGEFALRLPSVLAGVALIPLIYWVVRRWFASEAAALLAACLVSIDPFCVSFSQEARVYALLQLIAVLHVDLGCRLLSRPTRSLRCTWVLLGGFLFHLHYTSALLILAELVCFTVMVVGRRHLQRYFPRQILLDAFLLIVLCLPAWGHLVAIFGRRANWSLFVPIPTLFEMLTLFPWGIYLLLPFSMAVLFGIRRYLRHSNLSVKGLDVQFVGMLGCWLVVPMLIASILTVLDVARLFWPRYMMTAYVAGFIGAGCCCASIVGATNRILTASMVVLTALVTYGPVGQTIYAGGLIGDRGENWRAAIEWVNCHANGASTVLYLQPGLIEANALRDTESPSLVSYCLFPVSSIYHVADTIGQRVPLPLIGAAELVNFGSSGNESVLLLVRGPEDETRRLLKQVERNLQSEAGLTVLRKHFAGLAVAKLQKRK